MSEAIREAHRSRDVDLIRAAMRQAIQKVQSLVLTYKAGTSGLHECGLVWLHEQQHQKRSDMYVPFAFRHLAPMFLETPMGRSYLEFKPRLFDQVQGGCVVPEPLEKLWEIQGNLEAFTGDLQLPAHFDFTTLHEKAARGNKISSDASAELKALVNVQDVTGWTPIFYACAAKNPEMVSQLFGLGADATLTDLYGYTVAHYACLSGCKKTLQILAHNGVDLESQSIDGAKPIHLAAGKGHHDVITSLFTVEWMYKSQRKAESVHLDFNNRTPMHWAAAGGHVKALIELKGDVNVQDDFGWSPLHTATLAGGVSAIHTLYQLSADLESRDSKGRTPLLLACTEEKWDVAGELVRIGAKVHVTDSDDMTPLHYLAAKKDDVNTPWLKSATLIPILIERLNDKAIQHLLASRDREGHTPLHLAAMKGKLDLITKLLELGADVDIKNDRGESPLFLALSKVRTDEVALDIAKVLVRGRSWFTVKSVDGRGLLDLARNRGLRRVVSFLEAERERLERET